MCIHEKYINPFTDFGFKKIFGDEENTELLESLINDILGFKGKDKIKKITFKNGELLPDSPNDRKAIFDLFCKDEKGSTFIVELQKVYQEHFQSRALYYTSFPIQEQAIRGAWDFSLTPIYFIGLLNFEVAKALKGDIIEKAFEKEEFISMPKVEQEKYNKNLKIYRDLVNSFATAGKEGYKKGIKEGIEEGIKEGIEQEKLEIAKKLLVANMEINFIVDTTGLSIEEIEVLKQ